MGHALLKVVLYLLVLGIGWYAETPVDPGARQREVDARWKDVRKPVQQECTLVRDHSGLFRPEPCHGQMFVFAGGEVN